MKTLLTKLKVYVATAMTLALVAGVYVLVDAIDKADDDNYVLSSAWHPATIPFNSPVAIKVQVDGITIISRTQRQSPFNATLTAERGARVVLEAYMGYAKTESLDCIIMRNGRTVPRTGFDSRKDPGWVRCQA